MKQTLSALLLAVVLALGLHMTVWAEETPAGDASVNATAEETASNEELEAKRLQLERAYSIRIAYELDPSGTASIGTGALDILDQTLGWITPQVVSQVSAYYRETVGNRLTISFVYSPYQKMGYAFDVLGSFDDDIGVIELYVPAYGRDVAMTGEAPLTVAHEFAHAFHGMARQKYGGEKLEAQWLALNGGQEYRGMYGPAVAYDSTAFITSYSTTSYEEDFAEVFSHAFVRHRDGMGMGPQLEQNGEETALGEKLALVEMLITKLISDSDQAVENLSRCRTADTYLDYQGVRLQGEELQFMGFSYPRYILRSILHDMGLEEEESQWVSRIGGWQVTGTEGDTYLVFPGGEWHRMEAEKAA